MNCPVCGKEAGTHIYYCAGCCVHAKCWQKHANRMHKK